MRGDALRGKRKSGSYISNSSSISSYRDGQTSRDISKFVHCLERTYVEIGKTLVI